MRPLIECLDTVFRQKPIAFSEQKAVADQTRQTGGKEEIGAEESA
jgi:hypothetical protein